MTPDEIVAMGERVTELVGQLRESISGMEKTMTELTGDLTPFLEWVSELEVAARAVVDAPPTWKVAEPIKRLGEVLESGRARFGRT